MTWFLKLCMAFQTLELQMLEVLLPLTIEYLRTSATPESICLATETCGSNKSSIVQQSHVPVCIYNGQVLSDFLKLSQMEKSIVIWLLSAPIRLLFESEDCGTLAWRLSTVCTMPIPLGIREGEGERRNRNKQRACGMLGTSWSFACKLPWDAHKLGWGVLKR